MDININIQWLILGKRNGVFSKEPSMKPKERILLIKAGKQIQLHEM